ncbi:serine hydrolase domain-containing protein [Sandarakinorhabdus sp. DWP1-3-1]|uniref:serine hydrolase domain-containing protein n=1 Tax=Sandarakinorhabdus sp. DWP1-3-1 TaxID=2804627 RepID=UPI003CFA12C0
MARTLVLRLLPFGLLAGAATAQIPPPNAADSDPAKRGWMQGSPPAVDKQVRFDDASMWFFPRTRWSFSHWRELVPTVAIPRAGAPSVLPRAERRDLDAIRFTPLGATAPMTWEQSLAANYTDGIVVLHRGRIVYERYAGAGGPANQHITFSVTKSFVGTLAETLIAEGRLDPARTIASYVPELATSGFGDASVRQALDMRTGIAFVEDYVARGSELTDPTRMSIAGGAVPAPPGYQGATTTPAFLAGIGKRGDHGGDFAYLTPNTQAVAWVIERVTGQSIAAQISARYWQPLGMEQDAALQVDRVGTGFAGGGMTAALRDMARFGEMIRRGGKWQGRQVVPPAAIRAIMAPGDAAAFAAARYPGLEGGSYTSFWWHRASGQTMAVGIHGQGIYIDPKAEMVIARFGSFPVATNRVINPTTLPAYDAMAAALTAR